MNKQVAKTAAAAVLIAATLAGCGGNADMRQQGANMDPNMDPNLNTRNAPLAQRQTVNNYGADNRIDVADQAARQVASIPGVRNANVLVTRNNAYVAAVLDDRTGQLTREVEDQIAAKVRTASPEIQNVYVSTNPEFVDRINAYIGDLEQGRPVSGFVEQFNEMIQRIFPNAR